MALVVTHTGLSVADLDRSVAFYRDVLGFELLRIIESQPNSRLGEAVCIPGCKARIAHLRHGDSVLELLEFSSPCGTAIHKDRTQAAHGFSHMGFESTDIWAEYARMKDQGVVFYSEPLEYRVGVWVAFFYGPDGESHELRQAPDHPLNPR